MYCVLKLHACLRLPYYMYTCAVCSNYTRVYVCLTTVAPSDNYHNGIHKLSKIWTARLMSTGKNLNSYRTRQNLSNIMSQSNPIINIRLSINKYLSFLKIHSHQTWIQQKPNTCHKWKLSIKEGVKFCSHIILSVCFTTPLLSHYNKNVWINLSHFKLKYFINIFSERKEQD